MKISSKACYGLKIMAVLTEHYDKEFVSSKKIAEREKISKKYTDNLLSILEKSGIVTSRLGSKGGYALAIPPENVTVKMILESLEGSILSAGCLDKVKRCRYSSGCSGHFIWENLKMAIIDCLDGVTLAQASKKAKR